jgi:hypothetical protein
LIFGVLTPFSAIQMYFSYIMTIHMKISITRQEKNDLLIQGLLNSDDMDRFDSTAIFVLLF